MIYSKRFNIVVCTFLFLIFPAFAAPGDPLTTTVMTRSGGLVIFTTIENEEEGENGHQTRHKQLADQLQGFGQPVPSGAYRLRDGSMVMIQWTAGPVDVPTGPVTGSGH